MDNVMATAVASDFHPNKAHLDTAQDPIFAFAISTSAQPDLIKFSILLLPMSARQRNNEASWAETMPLDEGLSSRSRKTFLVFYFDFIFLIILGGWKFSQY